MIFDEFCLLVKARNPERTPGGLRIYLEFRNARNAHGFVLPNFACKSELDNMVTVGSNATFLAAHALGLVLVEFAVTVRFYDALFGASDKP
jgi:hypothetical protein